MRISHVIPHFNDEASGPSQSVVRLCELQAARHHRISLICAAAGRPPAGVDVHEHREWRLTKPFAFSPALALDVWRLARESDVLHNHSLWAFPNIATGWLPRRGLLVTSPRGTLSPVALSRSRAKKALFRPAQWRVLTSAAGLHATSPGEHDDMRAAGLRAPIAIIPNGIDIPELPPKPRDRPVRRLLFLARLHPIKGLELLLDVWKELVAEHRDWELVVAGKGEPEYERILRARVAATKLARVSLVGPVYGAEKSALYSSSDLYVLPTQTENFGMTIAEALAHGVPVVTTHGAPWSGLAARRCGWWVPRTEQDLGAALLEAMKCAPGELHEAGLRGRDWMREDFEWTSVAERVLGFYSWLREGGPTPAHVRVSA